MDNFVKNKLFDLIASSLESPAADVVFIDSDYIKLADDFQAWLVEAGLDEFTRFNDDKCITFNDSQASYWFTDDPNICPWDHTVVTAPYWKKVKKNKNENNDQKV